MILTEFLSLAKDLTARYWPYIGTACFIVLLPFYIGQCGRIADMQKAPAKVEAVTSQDMGGKIGASSAFRAKITAKPCPPAAVDGQGKCPPCEAVAIDFEAINNAYAEGAASQRVTATASQGPNLALGGQYSLWIGAGYLDVPYATVGAQIGAWNVEGQRSLTSWGGRASYRLLEF